MGNTLRHDIFHIFPAIIPRLQYQPETQSILYLKSWKVMCLSWLRLLRTCITVGDSVIQALLKISPSFDIKDDLEQFASSGRWSSIQRSDIAIISIHSPILLMGLKHSFIYGLLFLDQFSSWTDKNYSAHLTYKDQAIIQLLLTLKLLYWSHVS